MRKATIVLLITISLLSFKCSQEEVNLLIVNNSDFDIVFAPQKNFEALIELNKGYHYDQVMKIDKKSQIEIKLYESDIQDYLADVENYKFYFISEIKSDEDSTIIGRKNDSLLVKRDLIKIGREQTNKFVYTPKEILFFTNK